ncbi:DNA ligase [Melia azedarach]|uniref:DNA ligase n=2 Tax=Melia azedarach TaxID=155640 RepID=A0ACC1YMU3_MELAZ|nr:DNA ligase [Melia azedarach]KAJ4725015.1 DNA ligase [Melia azedarach]
MLTLRSCCPFRYAFLSHNLLKPTAFSAFSLSFSNKDNIFLKLKPLSLSLNPKRKMSSRPSAFDALMSNARAAAKKKPQPTSSSPKKRKTLDNQNPKTINSSATKKIQENTEESSVDLQKPIENDTVKPKAAEEPVNDCEKPGKKVKLVNANERIAELKSEIVLLKKKAGDFDPKMVACWERGERVPFIFLSLVFDMISNETGRILITDIVCNMLRTVMDTTPEDLVAVVYLAANKVAPAHEGLELGIGDASIIKALAEACGRTETQVKKQYKEMGDLGLVAKASRSSQSMMRKPDPLTIAKVFDTFRLIAKEAGKDSQEKKKNRIKALLVAATDCEPQYLIRLLQSKLRIGLAEQTLLAALGQAAVYNEQHSKPPPNIQSPLEEAAKIVKQVYSVLPVYDKIVPALLSNGVWNLPNTCSFTLGVPVGPMLAKPTKGVSEIVNKFQDMEFTCEYKYDGERAQIHYMEDGSVEIYSRNAEHNTGKFPDVVLAISRLKKPSVRSFVLDCELVAYDREKQKILPFQILSTRARKNVSVNDIKVDVCIYAFDILYLNDQPLLQEQLKVRREHLYNSFEEEPGFFQFATALTSNDLDEIQKFLDAAVDASCEGLIIKTMDRDATYEPSKRSLNWLKLKKDYIESIGDSLDLVPIAAFHGRGKRTGVYGAFLLACYDSNNEEFQSICKIGTGFSEAMLEERSSSLRSKVIPKPKSYYRYADTIDPDVWFEPTEVWEVKAADLTISPVHRAAIGVVDPDKGISLRFPRLIRVREDKTPEQASSSEQVAEMYTAQKHNHPNNQDDNEDE